MFERKKVYVHYVFSCILYKKTYYCLFFESYSSTYIKSLYRAIRKTYQCNTIKCKIITFCNTLNTGLLLNDACCTVS